MKIHKKKKSAKSGKQFHPGTEHIKKVAGMVMQENLVSLAQQIQFNLRYELLKGLENINTQVQALKTIVKDSFEWDDFDSTFKEAVHDVEDSALGRVKKSTPAEEGDSVRFEIFAREYKDGKETEKWQEKGTYMEIDKLLMPNAQGVYRMGSKEVEEQFVGVKAGEEKAIVSETRQISKDEATGQQISEVVERNYLAKIIRVSGVKKESKNEKESSVSGKAASSK